MSGSSGGKTAYHIFHLRLSPPFPTLPKNKPDRKPPSTSPDPKDPCLSPEKLAKKPLKKKSDTIQLFQI